MFDELTVRVSKNPDVDLLVAQSYGRGEKPLLVLHGGPDWDHSYLREPLVRLVDRHRLVMPDLRGCGRSTRGLSEDQYTPDAVVADLVALLDELGIDQADVIGFSYGGLIAQRLTLCAPGRVRRLIIASSSVLPVPADAFAGWTERDRRRAAEVAVWADQSGSGPEQTRAAAVAAVTSNVWLTEAQAEYLKRIKAINFSAEWMRPLMAGTLPSPRFKDAVIRLASLGKPILLLHGREDMIFPADLAKRAAQQIPTARAVVIAEAGHMAHIDQPECWLNEIATFLA